MPDAQRPRERLLNHGPTALSEAELLAIILRTGTTDENVLHLAERILAHYNGLHGLAQASVNELMQFKGLGAAKITHISAALELGKRLITYNPQERPLVNRAEDAVRLVADMGQLTQEHVRVILLDSSRHVIAIPTIYIGTINASVLRVAEVLRDAVTRNSPAIIVVHNHPSGDSTPSPEDIELTHALIAGARVLDIMLVDHLIIGQNSWSSLKELGLAF
jgi:DNA repair protein RadC